MTPEIRRVALRAAAKAALVVSLAGCSGGTRSPAPPPANTTGRAADPITELACPAYLDGLATTTREALAKDDPLKKQVGVYGAFADVAARGSAKTKDCCTQDLKANGSSSKHRWACCSALGKPHDNGAACTPWGPPCPPEMA
jgi:hypothetical protein